MPRLADQIRQYVIVTFIQPARHRGAGQVRIRAGDVHRDMALKNRMPAVCGALDTAIILERAKVTLVRRSGPHQGANAAWVFAL